MCFKIFNNRVSPPPASARPTNADTTRHMPSIMRTWTTTAGKLFLEEHRAAFRQSARARQGTGAELINGSKIRRAARWWTRVPTVEAQSLCQDNPGGHGGNISRQDLNTRQTTKTTLPPP